MQETNISSSCFIQLLYSLMMGHLGQKHEWVSAYHNIVVNLIQLYTFAVVHNIDHMKSRNYFSIHILMVNFTGKE